MSTELSELVIKNFSLKEQEIAKDIREQDDSMNDSEGFVEFINDFLMNVKNNISNYRDEPSAADFRKLSLDDALDTFHLDEWPKNFIGYLACCAEWTCESFGCSFKLYGVSAFSALWFVAKGDLAKAAKYAAICFQPLLSMMRISDIPKDRGKLGGRPEHPLKHEAIKLGKQKWGAMDYASLNIVATAVKHQLDKRYKTAPSLPAIKKWLTDAKVRPVKSVR